MKTKQAKDLKAGDIVFDHTGRRMGQLIDDPEILCEGRVCSLSFEEVSFWLFLPRTRFTCIPWSPEA